MLADLLTGAALGTAGGLSPGPLTALVIRQALRHGSAEGAKVAVAPLVTDGPLLLGSAWLASVVGDRGLALISVLGAGFLVWLGVQTLRSPPLSLTQEGPAGSVVKAVATNLLNPHPYIFWIAVGGPLVATAESLPALLFGFFGCLCGSKVLIAIAAGHFREALTGRAYRTVMVLLGLSLFVFAALFLLDAFRLSLPAAA